MAALRTSEKKIPQQADENKQVRHRIEHSHHEQSVDFFAPDSKIDQSPNAEPQKQRKIDGEDCALDVDVSLSHAERHEADIGTQARGGRDPQEDIA